MDADHNRVLYKCGCDRWAALAWLYLCRYCMKVRCKFCARDEVDLRFCLYCGDSFPLKEAIDKVCRCYLCRQCPICMNALVLKSYPDQEKKTEEYYQCSYCRWSMDAKLKETENRGAEAWGPFRCTYLSQVKSLIRHYRLKSSIYKFTDDKRRVLTVDCQGRRLFTDDKARLKVFQPLMLKGIIPTFQMLSVEEKEAVPKPHATNEFPAASEQVVKCDDASNRLGIVQIYSNLSELVERVEDLLPVPRQISSRLARRCKECERFLIKAERVPKFKIKRLATFFLPVCKFVQTCDDKDGSLYVVLSLANCTDYPMRIKLSSVEDNQFTNSQIILPTETISLLPSPEYSSYQQALRELAPGENKNDWFLQRKENTVLLKLELVNQCDTNASYIKRFAFNVHFNCTRMIDITTNPKQLSDSFSYEHLPMEQMVQHIRISVSTERTAQLGVSNLFNWYYNQPGKDGVVV